MSHTSHPHFCITPRGNVYLLQLNIPDHFESLEFDTLNHELAEAINRIGQARWVLDMSRVHYVGSALLGLLINLRTRIRRSNGQLIICCMEEMIQRVLRAGSMERLFVIVETPDQAVQSLQ